MAHCLCSSSPTQVANAADKRTLITEHIEMLKQEWDLYPLTFDDIERVYYCELCGEVIYLIEKYKDEHRPENQNKNEQGVLIDPVLPWSFESTPNNYRSSTEMNDWRDRLYIETTPGNEESPFTVKCLDGGAWDRPTYVCFCETLEQAVEVALDGKDNEDGYFNLVQA